MFKDHSDMGHCFSEVVVVSKKRKIKKMFFFLTFLNWGKQAWYLEKRWPFLIGNGAEIQLLEKVRKSPEVRYFYSCRLVQLEFWSSPVERVFFLKSFAC